jgi:hypothetical protein
MAVGKPWRSIAFPKADGITKKVTPIGKLFSR